MQEALRKTAKLLKTYPALFAPMAVVGWIVFYLEWFQKAATHFILHQFLIGHSVLGYSVPMPDPTHEYVRRGMMLLLPFSFVLRILIFSIYVAGFVLTTRLVRGVYSQQKLDWVNALLALRARCVRVVVGSAILMGVFVLAFSLVTAIGGLQVSQTLREKFSFMSIVRGESIFVGAVIAWIVIPLCFKLIADRWASVIPAQQKLWGRIAAIVIVIVSGLLSATLADWTPHINFALADAPPLVCNHIVWPLISILGDLPLALLWVFLGVLLFDEPETAEIPSPS
jgi:hypothetical protein